MTWTGFPWRRDSLLYSCQRQAIGGYDEQNLNSELNFRVLPQIPPKSSRLLALPLEFLLHLSVFITPPSRLCAFTGGCPDLDPDVFFSQLPRILCVVEGLILCRSCRQCKCPLNQSGIHFALLEYYATEVYT